MATPQETDNRPQQPNRRPLSLRKMMQLKIVKIPLVLLAVGVILWFAPRVTPLLISLIESNTVFGALLTLACAAVSNDHIRLRSKKKWHIMWWIYVTVAAYATVVLYHYDNNIERSLAHLALFPLLALMAIAFYLGIKHLFQIRKIRVQLRKRQNVSNKDMDVLTDATYTGHLYLVAATLTAIVTTTLAKRFGPPMFHFYGDHYQSLSIVLFLLEVALLLFAVAKRADLVYEVPPETDSEKTMEIKPIPSDNGRIHGELDHPDTQSFLDGALGRDTDDGTFYDPDPTGPIPGTPIREPEPAHIPATHQWPTDPPKESPSQTGMLT